ncbi:MAG TPA: hypothetical protein DD636_02095 [Anaerolineaceae bacterium]|nr:hypothetical protein [Anaerolineaceae bacterium]
MEFFKNFLKNLGLLVVLGVVLLLVAPDMMRQVYDAFGQLFGPLVIVMIIVAALPRRKRTRS